MDPTKLSHELRTGSSPDLTRRRWILGLSLLGALMGKIVALYQMGILRDLPDPPFDVFDSSRVDAAPYAYSRFNSPDGPIMLVGYGVTGWLAAAGGKDRAARHPGLPLLMTLKIAGDVALALQLAREEWRDTGHLCAYCQVATVASIVSLGLALPEARRALEHLTQGDSSETFEDKAQSLVEQARELVQQR